MNSSADKESPFIHWTTVSHIPPEGCDGLGSGEFCILREAYKNKSRYGNLGISLGYSGYRFLGQLELGDWRCGKGELFMGLGSWWFIERGMGETGNGHS